MDIQFGAKVAVITGASAGIGEATAILFSKCGAKLSLIGRNKENLDRVAKICQKESGFVPLQIIADLATETSKQNMDIQFGGKVAVITGASAGIGEATAILFSKCGAKLSLIGRNKENLDRVAKICQKESGFVPLQIIADLATEEGCEKAASETLKHFNRVDVLVNNAGVGARNCLAMGTSGLQDLDRVMATNIRGVYHLTALLAPALEETKGNIVNISSISGMKPSVGSLPYSMSKAALDQFTRCIALELAPKGVRVNTVNPGITVSTFVQRLTSYTDEQYQKWLQEAAKEIPMGRVSESDDVARAIAFLASDHAAIITGTTITVDGGLVLGSAAGSTLMSRQIKK